MRPVRLVHLVSPVDLPGDHPLARAQVVTYESMRRAVAYAAAIDPKIKIDLVAAVLPDDLGAIPNGFIQLPELRLTSSSIGKFRIERRLPILGEIIERAYYFAKSIDVDPAPHIIFTNVDIGVQPHFYTYVAWLIRCGHDVALINRRSIADQYRGLQDLPAMLSDFGHVHPGLDCFVFESAIARRFVPFKTVIGMAHVMRPLFFNLIAFSREPVVLTDAHATFHIGNDREWTAEKYSDYDRFNRSECVKVIKALCDQDPALESRLTEFVNATEEHKWIPEGLLGVRRQKKSRGLYIRLRNRLSRFFCSE